MNGVISMCRPYCYKINVIINKVFAVDLRRMLHNLQMAPATLCYVKNVICVSIVLVATCMLN